MKKELDIRGDLAKRKYKRPNPIIAFVYFFLMGIIALKYRPHYKKIDKVSKCKGPCFLVFNHLSRIDHSYLVHAAWPKRINILAAYSEFFRSHLHTVFKLNAILPKKNYAVNDLAGTKAIMSVINKGGCVAFAPEGLASNDGMNKPVVPKTGHMLKHFGIPVYFCELRGAYLQNTKVCLDERYGKTYATTRLLFSPEDLQKMTGEEIDEKLNEAFRGDEYVWQKEKHIKWKTNGRICEHLDDMLYTCPRCKRKFEMEAKLDFIKCKACGNGATMDDYYDFHPYDDTCVIPETPSRWVDMERVDIIEEIRQNEKYAYSERVKIGRLPNDHYLTDLKTSEIVSEGTLTIDHSGVRYKGEDTNQYDFDLDYNVLYTTITELDSSYINIYVGNEYTDIFPLERRSGLFMNMLIEEMHRLHVNTYKNFKWNNWMYEEEKTTSI